MLKLKGLFTRDPFTHESLDLFKAHFKIVKKLGRGSFATVYEVRRRADGRRYALKHINMEVSSREKIAEVVNEIRLLASLDHPHLIQYHEAFVDGGHHLFIVCELATGGDLASLLEKRAEAKDWLPERHVWCWFLQLKLAVRYLHHRHVLHRDLKPQNVLLAEPGGPLKVADLGISQILDYVFTTHLTGSPNYVSPEMWRREPYSYSADVWALGCILYQLCALRPLFEGATVREVRDQVLSGLLHPLPSQYSLDLWDVVRVMLTPDPAERPTIDEVLQMPAVRARMHLLPPEDLAYLEREEEARAPVAKPIMIPSRVEQLDELNELLPPPNYPGSSGPGFSELLLTPPSSPLPESYSDPTTLLPSPRTYYRRRESRSGPSSGQPGGGSQRGAEEAGQQRSSPGGPVLRKSVTLGEVLCTRQMQQQEAAEAGEEQVAALSAAGRGGAAAASEVGAAGVALAEGRPMPRAKSSGDVLHRLAEQRTARGAAALGASSALHAAFDATPVEFGRPHHACHAARCPAPHQPASLRQQHKSVRWAEAAGGPGEQAVLADAELAPGAAAGGQQPAGAGEQPSSSPPALDSPVAVVAAGGGNALAGPQPGSVGEAAATAAAGSRGGAALPLPAAAAAATPAAAATAGKESPPSSPVGSPRSVQQAGRKEGLLARLLARAYGDEEAPGQQEFKE